MKLYRYSPIKSTQELQIAMKYVITKSLTLCEKIIGESLTFSGGLTIFAHYYEEYEYLQALQLKLGMQDSIHNGIYVTLNEPLQTKNGAITKLRVRHPDPYRYQVGCLDFSVNNYETFKSMHVTSAEPYLREIARPDLTMLEFWHPDFDVAAYIVK